MPRLNSLLGGSKVITLHYQGEDVKLTYRPDVWTPDWEDKMKDPEQGSESIIEMLVGIEDTGDRPPMPGVLADWDLLEDDDSVVPLNRQRLQTIPSPFLLEVLSAIWEDMTPGEVRRLSNAGSRRRA